MKKTLAVIVEVNEDHGSVVDIATTFEEGKRIARELMEKSGKRHDVYYREWDTEENDGKTESQI